MRTTVSLDPDVVEQLKDAARRRGQAFRTVLNDTIRAGLAVGRGPGRPYKVVPRKMRLREGIDLTQALKLSDALEDQEIVRRLELVK